MATEDPDNGAPSEVDGALANAMQMWQQGQQEPALSLIRPVAEAGDPAARLLISFFFAQLGQPRIQEAVPLVKEAADEGNPWILSYYFPVLADTPATRADAAALVASTPTRGVGSNDPVGRALQFATEGDTSNAIAMLRAASGPFPWPPWPGADELRRQTTEISQTLIDVRTERDGIAREIQAASAQVRAEQEALQTRGNTLGELMNNLTNASAQSHFDEQATKYEGESRWLWTLGVVVLTVAALAAFLPVILNYADSRHTLHGQSNVSAHLGAAVALAAVAGVLLARARSRDRARQRNRDLSVALGTMFAYSEQITNDDEKERFKHDMGRLILETFLQQQPATEDSSRSIVGELLSSRGTTEPPA